MTDGKVVISGRSWNRESRPHVQRSDVEKLQGEEKSRMGGCKKSKADCEDDRGRSSNSQRSGVMSPNERGERASTADCWGL
jgi:hypothetical protein